MHSISKAIKLNDCAVKVLHVLPIMHSDLSKQTFQRNTESKQRNVFTAIILCITAKTLHNAALNSEVGSRNSDLHHFHECLHVRLVLAEC